MLRENRRAELTLRWRGTYNRCKCDGQSLRSFWRWRCCSFRLPTGRSNLHRTSLRRPRRHKTTKTRGGGGPAISDAVYEAWVKKLSPPPRPPGDQPDVVRRVMILISDGEDNLSTHTRADAIEMAQRTSVVIYTISTSTQWIQLSQTDPSKSANRKMHLTEGDEILKNLADETGGRAFFPYHVDDLNQSFQDIGDELRNQYTITYSPSNFVANGKYHRIKIEIPNHNGYQVRARRGYFAKSRTNAAKPAANSSTNPSPPAPAGQSPPSAKP